MGHVSSKVNADPCTPYISIHWCHYLKSLYDLRVFSKRRPFQILRSMADLLVRADISDFIERRFEKVWNSHTFGNWDIDLRIWKEALIWGTDVCDIEIRHGFENWTSIRGYIVIWVLHIYTHLQTSGIQVILNVI